MSTKTSTKYDLTRGSIWKTVTLYGLPILLSQLIQYLYNLADTMIIGNRLGEQYMGAVSASGTTSGLFFSLIFGMTGGFAVSIGVAFGAKEENRTLRSIVSSELLCIAVGLFIGILGASLSGVLVKVMNFSDTAIGEQAIPTAEIAKRYLVVIFGGAVVTMFNNMQTAILRTLGNSKAPVFTLTLSAFVNVGLNLIFLEYTSLNEVGVALATVLSQLVSAAVSLVILFRTFPQFNFFQNRTPLASAPWWEQLRIGIPMGLQNSLIMIGAVIVQAAVNELEKEGIVFDAMASYAASNSINNISSTLINTFGMVVSGFVSQNYGARNYLRIRKGVTICLIYSWILAFVVGTTILLFDRGITGLFVDEWNEALYQNVHTFLMVNLPFYLIWVPVPIFRFAIQGMKNTLLPFLSCLVELPMRCLTAWAFGQWWGFAGISLATPAALVAAFLFLTVSYFVVLKRKKREMEGETGEKFLEPVANSEES